MNEKGNKSSLVAFLLLFFIVSFVLLYYVIESNRLEQEELHNRQMIKETRVYNRDISIINAK